MSHYLARLVERTRGTAARVEPIVAPRYAPSPPEQTVAEAAPSRNPPGTSPASPRSGPNPRRTMPATPAAKAPPRPPLVEKQAVSQRAEPPDAGLAVVRETLLVPMRPEQAREEIVVRPKELREAPPKFPTRKPPPAARPAKAAALPPIALAPRQPNEPATEQPIVRVTIGRIEVRATPSPAAPPRRPPARSEPSLTLDGYLKERAEGRR